ncbi:MAG: peptidyl-tRNA hydrolase [Chlamydiota bacterium]|jgi:PTH1 family peptidyl-tRNA hydrolase
MAVAAFVEQQGLKWKKSVAFRGKIAEDQGDAYMLPETYMNESGEAVGLVRRYYKIALTDILVVVDDIAIPFGVLRLRQQGSSGGHNGLKSVEEHLGSDHYSRLRIGVGDREEGDLASFVLAPFSDTEKVLLPDVLAKAKGAIGEWLKSGVIRAMDVVNRASTKPEQEEPS